MDAKQREIADKIKNILVENLRLPAEDLTDDAKLFGDDIGLDSVDSLEIIAGIDQEFGVSMMGVSVRCAAAAQESLWKVRYQFTKFGMPTDSGVVGWNPSLAEMREMSA